jgi:hypothetical protein
MRILRSHNPKMSDSPLLSRKTRIMAAMPHFSQLRVKQREEKDPFQSERWQPRTEFLKFTPPDELKEIISLV